MIGRVARRLAPAGVLVGVALAGCDTVGSINRTGGVAVVEEQSKEASGANISSLSDVIQRNPSDPSAYNTRGAAYARIGRYGDAMSDFGKAVQIDPNYAPAYIGRGNLLRAQGQYQEALNDLSVAIRLLPESAEALHARGLLYQRQGL